MKEEDDTLGDNLEGEGTVTGDASASAPALLGDMAEFLVTGIWGSTRFHNVTDSGFDPNNGVLTYNVSGYSTDADGISAERAALVREAFQLFEATLGIDFQETTSTNTSEVDFFFSDNSSGAYAGSSIYSNGEIAYSYINIADPGRAARRPMMTIRSRPFCTRSAMRWVLGTRVITMGRRHTALITNLKTTAGRRQ